MILSQNHDEFVDFGLNRHLPLKAGHQAMREAEALKVSNVGLGGTPVTCSVLGRGMEHPATIVDRIPT